METGHSTAETEQHAGAHSAHEAGHGDDFYAQTNPKYFGLPLGVLIAAGISAAAVSITLLKFLSDTI